MVANANSITNTSRPAMQHSKLAATFLTVTGAFSLILVIFNASHAQYHHEKYSTESAIHNAVSNFIISNKPPPKTLESPAAAAANIHQLTCSDPGGPANAYAQEEMAYWEDIPTDKTFPSVYQSTERRFLTFEPDGGGWNNVRQTGDTLL
jgi:hypothetical protein